MGYVDCSIWAIGKPADSIAHQGRRDLGEGRRFNAGNAMPQQNIYHSLFQVWFERASQEIETIDFFALQLGLNPSEVRFDPIKVQTTCAEEPQQMRPAHGEHEFFG